MQKMVAIDTRAVVGSATFRRKSGSALTPRMLPASTHKEKSALQLLLKLTEKLAVSAADAMPADKYGLHQRTVNWGVYFGQMVKHLSATNYILPAAAWGGAAGRCRRRAWPEAVRTESRNSHHRGRRISGQSSRSCRPEEHAG
jgi:hypothetical protein